MSDMRKQEFPTWPPRNVAHGRRPMPAIVPRMNEIKATSDPIYKRLYFHPASVLPGRWSKGWRLAGDWKSAWRWRDPWIEQGSSRAEVGKQQELGVAGQAGAWAGAAAASGRSAVRRHDCGAFVRLAASGGRPATAGCACLGGGALRDGRRAAPPSEQREARRLARAGAIGEALGWRARGYPHEKRPGTQRVPGLLIAGGVSACSPLCERPSPALVFVSKMPFAVGLACWHDRGDGLFSGPRRDGMVAKKRGTLELADAEAGAAGGGAVADGAGPAGGAGADAAVVRGRGEPRRSCGVWARTVRRWSGAWTRRCRSARWRRSCRARSEAHGGGARAGVAGVPQADGAGVLAVDARLAGTPGRAAGRRAIRACRARRARALSAQPLRPPR